MQKEVFFSINKINSIPDNILGVYFLYNKSNEILYIGKSVNVKKRVVVEAAHSFGWHKYIGIDGICITMDRFGASAPGGECMKNFGFTVENVVNKTKEIL